MVDRLVTLSVASGPGPPRQLVTDYVLADSHDCNLSTDAEFFQKRKKLPWYSNSGHIWRKRLRRVLEKLSVQPDSRYTIYSSKHQWAVQVNRGKKVEAFIIRNQSRIKMLGLPQNGRPRLPEDPARAVRGKKFKASSGTRLVSIRHNCYLDIKEVRGRPF